MRYVAYYRVSRSDQSVGAQEAAVRAYLKPGDTLAGEFREWESGRMDGRPVLREAVALSRSAGAVLLIARIDRLSRNHRFVAELRDSGVRFRACDMPEADELVVGIMALFAEREVALLRDRTRAALAVLKARAARGESWTSKSGRECSRLGTPGNLTPDARRMGTEAVSRNARAHQNNVQSRAMAMELRGRGMALSLVAGELNRLGFRTRRGCLHTACSVKRLVERE